MKNRVFIFSLFLATLYFGSSARAQNGFSAQEKQKLPTILHYGIDHGKDGAHAFFIKQFVNQNGENEWQVSLKEDHIIGESHQPILVGRDLDGDEKIDTWFVRNSVGVTEIIHSPNSEKDSTDGLHAVIEEKLKLEKRWLTEVAFINSGAFLSFAISAAEEMKEDYTKTEIDLLDMEARADRLKVKDPKNALLPVYYAMIEKGWKENEKKLSSLKGADYWKLGALDLATFYLGAKAISWAGGKIAQTQAFQYVNKNAANLIGWAQKVMETHSERLGLKKLAALNAAGTTPALLLKAFTTVAAESTAEQTKKMIAGMVQVQKLSQLIAPVLKEIKHVALSGVKEWKYILITQGTQVGAEMIARADHSSFDGNVLVLGKNVLTNQEVQQNLMYMTNETFLMASVASSSSNIKKRVLICGLIGMIDSLTLNLLIHGNPEAGRVAIDTSWEVFIGNLQTQIDIHAIQHFEKMALKSGNGKLKFVGYAIAFIDQGIGYWGYSKTTQWYDKKNPLDGPNKEERNQESKFKLIPIFSPAAVTP